MRQNFLICCLSLLISSTIFAQQSGDKKYKLIAASSDFNIALLSIADPYLSPLTYSGLGVGYQHTEQKYFDAEKTDFSMRGRWNVLGGLALNPAFSTAMTYAGGEYSWGTFYHYRKFMDVQMLLGATTDAQFGVKSISRNVNNPVNMDAAVNLNLAAALRYNFRLFGFPMRLNYELEAPIAGCMFVPVQGASFYEMFQLWNLQNAFHFSSLHNKTGLNYNFGIDFKFKKSTWNLKIAQQRLLYKANDMVFKRSTFGVSIGYKYDLYVFKGRNNAAPTNFISTEK